MNLTKLRGAEVAESIAELGQRWHFISAALSSSSFHQLLTLNSQPISSPIWSLLTGGLVEDDGNGGC